MSSEDRDKLLISFIEDNNVWQKKQKTDSQTVMRWTECEQNRNQAIKVGMIIPTAFVSEKQKPENAAIESHPEMEKLYAKRDAEQRWKTGKYSIIWYMYYNGKKHINRYICV